MKLSHLIFITFVFALSACNSQKSQRQEHDPTPEEVEMFVHSLEGSDISDKQEKLIEYFYDNKTEFLRQLDKADYDSYRAVVQPLKGIFFNERFITSRDHKDVQKTFAVLHIFNKGIISMIQSDHKLVLSEDKKTNILHQYYEAVELDCSNGRSTCDSRTFYRNDKSQSYKVTFALTKLLISRFKSANEAKALSSKEIIDQSTEIYKVFELTIYLKDNIQDLEFNSLFVTFQIDVKNMLKSAKATRTDLKNYEEVIALYPRVNGLMAVASSLQNKDTKEYREFLNALSPLSCGKRVSANNAYCSSLLFNDAIKYQLVDHASTIETLNSIFDKDVAEGRLTVNNDLARLTKNQVTLFNLSIDGLSKLDKVVYLLIDRIFTEEWDENQATKIWDVILRDLPSRKDYVSSLEKIISQYAKRLILQQGNKSIKHLRDSFNREDLFVQDRFQIMLNESDVPSRQWGDVMERFKILEQFLKKQLVRNKMRNSELDAVLENITTLPQNLNMAMVYPTMMIYSSIVRGEKLENLSRFDGESFQHKAFSPFLLLIGRISPWFLFGNNDNKINYSEAILSTYLLFRSGFIAVTAEEYPADFVNKDMAAKGTEAVTQQSILKYLIEDMFITDFNNFSDYFTDYNEFYNAEFYNRFENACQQVKRNQPISLNPYLLDLDYSVVLGRGSKGMIGAFEYFYYGAEESSKNSKLSYFFNIRSSIKRKLRLVETLKISYMSFLEDQRQHGIISTSELTLAKASAEELFKTSQDKIKNLVSQYGGTVFHGHNAFSQCMYPIIEKEFKAQRYLREEIVDYVKQVYASIATKRGVIDKVKSQAAFSDFDFENINTKINLVSQKNPKTNQVEEIVIVNDDLRASADLSLRYSSKEDMVNDRSYQVSKIDILLLIKRSLESMTESERNEIGVSIDVSMPPRINETPLVKEPSAKDVFSVQFSEDFNTFKNDFLKLLFRYEIVSTSPEFFIGWAGLPTDLDFLPGRIKMMSEYVLISNFLPLRDAVCEKRTGKECIIDKEDLTNSTNIFKEYALIRNLMHIDPEDEEEIAFLQNLGRSTRFPMELIRTLFFDDHLADAETYMEKAFDALSDEVMPRIKWGGTTSESTVPIGLGFKTRFYVQQRDSQNLLFDKSPYMKKELRNLFRHETVEYVLPAVELLQSLGKIDCYLPPMTYNVTGDQVGQEINEGLANKVDSCIDHWSLDNDSPVKPTLSSSEQKALREIFITDDRINDFKSFIRKNFYKTTDCEYATGPSDTTLINEAQVVENFFELKEKETCQ